MKAFLSPVYLQTNAASDEKITAGLVIVTPGKIWFHYSFSKLNLLKKLLSVDAYYNSYNSFSNMESKVMQSNQQLSSEKTSLFKSDLPFNSEYFTYLSKYSSGLVQFGSPNPIDSIIDEVTFANYYKIFVGESIKKEKSPKSQFNTTLKQQLSKPGLTEKADINFKLSSAIVHGLIKDTDVSLITKNGSIKTYQGIDFMMSEKSIVDNLYEFEVLVNALKKIEHHNKFKKGNYSIVAEEPPLNTQQHKLFDQVYKYKSDVYSLIDSVNFDSITDEIIQNDHSKFSEFLSASFNTLQ